MTTTTLTKDQEIAQYVEEYTDMKTFFAITAKYGDDESHWYMKQRLDTAKSAINYLLMNDARPAKPYPVDEFGNFAGGEWEYMKWEESVGEEFVEEFNQRYEAELNQMIDDAVTAYLASK